MAKKEFKPIHYWICDGCATKAGGVWPKDHTATVMHGICKYCNDPTPQTIIPWVDFNWPSKSLTKRAAIQRD